ncbi:hypothetical protein [Phaeovulum sp.]|uniref:hypothetical protein n=1 Tax=Phaeovulum sp. TaxID=2934796 RepID=UPI00356946DD
MSAKKWADRLPLDDIRGIIAWGSALYHAYTRLAIGAGPYSDHVAARIADLFERAPDLKPSASSVNAASAARNLASQLDVLGASESAIEAARDARFGDFQYFAEDLHPRPNVTWHVIPIVAQFSPPIDQECPIALNQGVDLEECRSLFERWYAWHTAPTEQLRNQAWPLSYHWPNRPEHYHFVNYVAPACEAPRPAQRPKGSGYSDAAQDATTRAWCLLRDAYLNGEKLSEAEAIRQSLLCFRVITPKESEWRLPAWQRDKGLIRQYSEGGAEKRIRKLLDEINEKEPYWEPEQLEPLSVFD